MKNTVQRYGLFRYLQIKWEEKYALKHILIESEVVFTYVFKKSLCLGSCKPHLCRFKRLLGIGGIHIKNKTNISQPQKESFEQESV